MFERIARIHICTISTNHGSFLNKIMHGTHLGHQTTRNHRPPTKVVDIIKIAFNKFMTKNKVPQAFVVVPKSQHKRSHPLKLNLKPQILCSWDLCGKSSQTIYSFPSSSHVCPSVKQQRKNNSLTNSTEQKKSPKSKFYFGSLKFLKSALNG